MTQEKELQIIKLYREGLSTRQIAPIIGCSVSPIKSTLKKYSIERRSRRVHFFNEHYFDIINSEDKAYFLGLLWADGNNMLQYGTNRISIGLQERDGYILEKFKRDIGFKEVLQFRKKEKDNHHNQLRLILNSKYLCEVLNSYGMTPNKSLTLQFPKDNIVPEDLIHHFIRGVFDGDGHIGVRNYKYGGKSLVFTLVGSIFLIKEIQNILIEKCGLNKVKLLSGKTHNENTKVLTYGGNKSCSILNNYLYKNATIFLTRKKEKFDSIEYIPYTYICKIEGCNGVHLANGLCSKHYQQESKKLQLSN